MSTLSILFYSKKAKATSEGRIPIYLRVTISGQRFEVSTKRYVEEKKWSSEAGRMKGNTEEARSLNSYLDSLRSKVYECQQELIREKQHLDIQSFKSRWLGETDRAKMIIEVFKYHNDQMRKLVGIDYAPGTMERFETSLSHTVEFLKWKYNVSDIDINAINYSFLTDYEFWLKTVRKCNQNTTTKYLSNFRKIINFCLKNGWLSRDPFFGFKMVRVEVEKEFLTESELMSIYRKDFSIERLGQVRDIFVFSCFTGLAYIDVFNLRRNQLTLGIDGNRWIHTHRQKTETASRIPLLPIAQEIVDKYADHPQCLNEGRVLPVLSNQKMNSYLKEIADLCGVNKNLTFHTARHTFATTVTLANGVPIESVSKMLGHKNLRMTQHYAKVLDKKVSDDMQILQKKYSLSSAAQKTA